MSGLVSGLQNRVRRFESARNLKKSSETTDNKQFRSFLILRGRKMAKKKHPAVRVREFASKSHAAKTNDGKVVKPGGKR